MTLVGRVPSVSDISNAVFVLLGDTLRRRMPIIVARLTLTPEKKAVIHRPMGTK